MPEAGNWVGIGLGGSDLVTVTSPIKRTAARSAPWSTIAAPSLLAVASARSRRRDRNGWSARVSVE